jgi:hypothetical protein
MRTLFAGSCAKELDRSDANEDFFTFSADRQRLALSDGASESYDSRVWARLLAGKFVEHPAFGPEWIQSAIADYMLAHDFAAMSWSQQLAFERGSFATLLAVEHDAAAGVLGLFGVGDSVAVLFDGASVALAWPLAEPERFRERPTLLSTIRQYNEFTRAPEFEMMARATLHLSAFEDPMLLCMTDALGEWTLRMSREEPERLVELLAIRSEAELASLVSAERTAKRMRVDDSTLIILGFATGEDGDGLPNP